MENTLDTLALEIRNLAKGFEEFKDAYEKGRDAHIEEHKAINKEIHGNGEDGLKTEVKMNTDFRKSHKKAMFAIFTALIGLAGSIIFALIKII